jgi:hypothetical protein
MWKRGWPDNFHVVFDPDDFGSALADTAQHRIQWQVLHDSPAVPDEQHWAVLIYWLRRRPDYRSLLCLHYEPNVKVNRRRLSLHIYNP